MPTPGWLRRQDLPVDAAGRSYIDPPSLDQILDQFVNWRGDVNAAGYRLLNCSFDAATKGAMQTPWVAEIDAAHYNLQNVGQDITHTSNTEWHFFSSVAQPIVFYTNSVERMRIVVGGGLKITGENAVGADAITGLTLDRIYGDVGDSMDIRWTHGSGASNIARISAAAVVGSGEAGLIAYVQTGGGDGHSNEVMRILGNGNVGIGKNSAPSSLLWLEKANPSGVGPDLTLSNSAGAAGDKARIGFYDTGTWRASIVQSLDPASGYGGQLDFCTSGPVTDVNALTSRFSISGTGVIKLWLGGSLKTLSVDGSGFVKAA